jgi:ParB family chromosome partitioning protein
MEKRLGRGLGSLLGEPRGREDLLEIELDRIEPNPFQPRKTLDPAGLEELTESIRSHGILQPIVVRNKGAGFELIAGERRWRAARLAGLRQVPAVIRDGVSDQDMLELALVENVQRRDLDPIERAQGFQALQEALGLTQEQVAERVGLKRSTVTNHLRLLELPQPVQDAVARGLVGMGHARALLGLTSERDRLRLLEQAVREDLSVREVERRVRSRSGGGAGGRAELAEKAPTEPARPAWAASLEQRMRETLGTKVTLQAQSEAKGRIVIDYYSREALDRLLEVLAPSPEV